MRQGAAECTRMHQDAIECSRMPPDAMEWARMRQDVPMVEVLVVIRLLTTPGAAWMSKWPWGPFVEV